MIIVLEEKIKQILDLRFLDLSDGLASQAPKV